MSESKKSACTNGVVRERKRRTALDGNREGAAKMGVKFNEPEFLKLLLRVLNTDFLQRKGSVLNSSAVVKILLP